ncbi:MAG: hypothetical protein BEN18_04115 [Epulopiscium sp. Nuni2H_MBin001]|nr:MAG: hypothetical protein BEN18_04115 [Epulopiscium sp. Nuni2H_MBin001]
MKIKLADSKLLILVAIFIFIISLMTIRSINRIDDNAAEFISNLQAEDVTIQFNSVMELLKDTADAMGNDKDTIEAIQHITQHGFTDESLQTLTDTLHNFTYIMSNLSYMNSIAIYGVEQEFIISDTEFIEDFTLEERAWYTPELMEIDSVVITDVYGNTRDGDLLWSAIKRIEDPDTNETIAFVLVNIYLQDLIAQLEADFRVADLDIFIEYGDGNCIYDFNNILYTTDQPIDYDELLADKNVNISRYDLPYGGDVSIVMVIDLDSIKANEFVAKNSQFVIWRILSLTLTITTVIILALTLLLRPVFTAVGSLVHIIDELGEEYPQNKLGISQVATMATFVEQSLPKKIKYLIYYDELTGLPNRKMFKLLYKNYSASTEPFVVMLLDIKNFKGINDTSGEEIGDKVLIEIGTLLTQAVVGRGGNVIRYSGDEFIILAPHEQLDNNVGEFFENEILPKFEWPLLFGDHKPINIEFNSVAVINPIHCGTEEDMITKIYVMLRKCKLLNTTRLYLFNNDVYSIYVNEERIKETLKSAIENNEFVVNYQPIVNSDKVVCKGEALIRWFSKDLGFVPPDKFIYLAEQTRLIIDLGNWIIERVAKDLQTLQAEGRDIQVSINISPIQIMEDDFVENAKAILDKYNINYKQICFEITESILIEERGVVKENIKALQNLGIALALDDFGTGYSSFSYLKEYSLDIIKIDKIFVDDASVKEFAIIDGINRISNALGMEMVVEGIETADQFEELKRFGLIQGYYFSRPVVWEEFRKLL